MRDKKGAVRWDRDSREDNQETEREREREKDCKKKKWKKERDGKDLARTR